MTRSGATLAIALIARTLGNLRLDDPERVAAWVDALEDLDDGQLMLAARSICRTATGSTWIAPGDLRALVLDQSAPPQPTSAEAWGLVLAQIGRGGGPPPMTREERARFGVEAPRITTGPDLPPLVSQALAGTTRWRDLCEGQTSDLPAHRARFIQAYESLAHRERQTALLPDALRRQIEAGRAAHASGTLTETSGEVSSPRLTLAENNAEHEAVHTLLEGVAAKWSSNGMDPELAGDS
jgi:hypothetical protein